MSFKIITDTPANLPTPLTVKEDITVIPLTYIIKGEEITCTDTEKFNAPEYYALLKSGEKITTSQINPQKYVDFFEPFLKSGEDILFVGISSGISGSFASSLIAKEQLEEDYPERKIRVVDSKGASMGEGLIVLNAVECKNKGMSLDETADFLDKEKERMYQVFTVDDLMYLRRGGRLSNAAALVGTILHIKPLLKGNEMGKIVTTGKVRGRKSVIVRLADKFKELAVDSENSLVAISHADCAEDAEYLAELIRERSEVKDIIIVNHEPVTGSYLGPGALALYFYGDKDVRLK